MDNEVFLDTAYAIALSSANDAYHERAMELAVALQNANALLITTRAIQLEIGNALSKQRYRPAAVQLLDSLEADPAVEIITLTETLYSKSLELFRERSDKDWGLVDCTSFVVMTERTLTQALTTDEHFQQAGFRALLREEMS